MKYYCFLPFLLLLLTPLCIYMNWTISDYKNSFWKLIQLEMKYKIPRISSKEAEIDRTIAYLAYHGRMTVDNDWMSSVRNVLLNLPQPPALPPDALEKSKDSLQSTVVPPIIRIAHKETWQGYPLPVITCAYDGRLGNVLGEYCSMYAIQKLYNISVFTRDDMREQLKHFPNLSISKLPVPFKEEDWRTVASYGDSLHSQYAPIELAAAGLLGPHPFVMKAYAMEFQLFHPFRDELRRELKFSINITTKAQQFLRSVKESREKEGFPDVVFIGFHVRRSDYIWFIKLYGGILPEDMYYHRAINYYRNKYPQKAVFIAASDDINYMKQRFVNYSDVFFSPGTTPDEDMGILSSCNHSIMTLGTFGFFCGFLTGGEVVYADVKYEDDYFISRQRIERSGLTFFTPLPVD